MQYAHSNSRLLAHAQIESVNVVAVADVVIVGDNRKTGRTMVACTEHYLGFSTHCYDNRQRFIIDTYLIGLTLSFFTFFVTFMDLFCHKQK